MITLHFTLTYNGSVLQGNIVLISIDTAFDIYLIVLVSFLLGEVRLSQVNCISIIPTGIYNVVKLSHRAECLPAQYPAPPATSSSQGTHCSTSSAPELRGSPGSCFTRTRGHRPLQRDMSTRSRLGQVRLNQVRLGYSFPKIQGF